jgi:hypothetical protein
MRIYIIGNDGITLCREAPAAVNEGEIAVASIEELHAARLSGKAFSSRAAQSPLGPSWVRYGIPKGCDGHRINRE